MDVAGPGFINFTLTPRVWQSVLPVILKVGNSFGNSKIGAGKKINVEYVSANPTGPLHIGHTRGAVYGDALATLLLKSGHDVTKEYYINDAGVQIGVLAESAILRYREACGETIGEIPAGLYPGEYLKAVGDALVAIYGDKLLKKSKAQQIEAAKPVAIDCMMALIKSDLADMGIVHDIFTSEAKLRADKKIETAIEKLTKLGHLYRGTLEAPKGAEGGGLREAKEQLLFRSSNSR